MSLPAIAKWNELGPRSWSLGKERTYATRYYLEFVTGVPRTFDPVEINAAIRPLFLPYWVTDEVAKLSSIAGQQLGEYKRAFHIDVGYTTDPQSQQANEDEDPLRTITYPRMRWGNRTEYTLVDVNGNPMCTTAGELYDPYAIDKGLPTLELHWNTLDFDQAAADAYRDATNSDQFYGRDPYTARVVDYDVEERRTSLGIQYFSHSAAIEFDPKGRKRKTYNAGFYKKNPDDPLAPIRLKDKDGEPRETTTFLTQDGTEELVIDMSKPPEDREKPIQQEWEVLQALPFAIYFRPQTS